MQKRMPDDELTAESLKAAAHYIKKTQQEGLGVVEKSSISNSVAHGFYMGVRWKEEQDGKQSQPDASEACGS